MAVKSYQELTVWQKGMDLVVAIYEVTKQFPQSEAFGLTNQVRRAAVSIPSNIAEGQGRRAPQDFMRFLNIAYGSLQEVETQLMLAQRLSYIDKTTEMQILNQCADVARLLNGLRRSLTTDN
jgi:four helix bundle protein